MSASAESRFPGSLPPLPLVVLIVTGSLFTSLIFVTLSPVLPAIGRHFDPDGGGALLAQWVMSAPSVGLILAGIAGGWLAERAGTPMLLAGALLLYVLAGTTGLYVDNATLMLAGRFVAGFAAGLVAIVGTGLIAVCFGEGDRGRYLGFKQAVGSAGTFATILAAGYLAQHFGWRMPFVFYGLLGLAGLLLLVPVMRGGGVPAISTAERAPDGAGGSFPWGRLVELWPLYLTIVVFGMVLMMVATQVPFLLEEIDASLPTQIAWTVASAGATSILGGLFYGAIERRVRPWGFPLILAIWTLGLGLLAAAGSLTHAVIGCGISGIAAGMFVPHMINTLMRRAHASVRARAIGLVYSAIFLGDFINPLVIGTLTRELGRHGGFGVVAGFCALCLLAAALRIRRQPAAA